MIGIGIHKFSNILAFHPRNITGYIADFNAKYTNTLQSDTGDLIEWSNSAQLTATEFHGQKASSLDGSSQYWSKALPGDVAGFNPESSNGAWSTNNSPTVTHNITSEPGSSKCIKVEKVSGSCGIYKAYNFTIGKKYKLVARYKSTVDLHFGRSGSAAAYGVLGSATSQWNTVVKTFVAQNIDLYITMLNGGAFWIDTITITEDWKLDLNESYELIKHSINRDFEQTLGAELATGTVTIGKKYIVTAGTVEGNTVGTEFLAITNATTLDASNKVREIPNLVTNGTFDSDTTGWTAQGGSSVLTHSTDCARVTQVADNFLVRLLQNNKTIIGMRYRQTFQLRASKNLAYGCVTTGRARFTSLRVVSNPNVTTSYQTYAFDWVQGNDTSLEIGNVTLPVAGDYIEIDNVHIYEIPEWTASGNHSCDVSTLDKSGTTGTQSLLISANGAGRGAEVITVQADREFSSDTGFWTIGTGASITGSKLVLVSGGVQPITRNSLIENGKTYEITFTVEEYIIGQIRAQCGSSVGAYVASNGTYIQRITSNGTQFSLYASSGTQLKIDNISIKEVLGEISLPSAQIDTLVSGNKYTKEFWAKLDPASLSYSASNMATNFDDFQTDGWTTVNGTTITSATTFEKVSGSTGGSGIGLNTAGLTVGKIYKCRLAGTGSATVGLYDWYNGTQGLYKTLGTGTFNETFYFKATATGLYIYGGGVSSYTVLITAFELYEATVATPTLTAQIGTKLVTTAVLDPNTFTKTVLNFEATASEVGQDLKLYLSGAGNVYVDNVSLTQAYDVAVSTKLNSGKDYWGRIISNMASSTNGISLYKRGEAKQWTFYSGDNVNNDSVSFTSTLNNSVFRLLTGIVNRTSTIALYENNILKGSINFTRGKVISLFNLVLGGTDIISFQGQIAPLQIIRFTNISQSNFDPTTYKIGQSVTGGGAEVVLYHDWTNVLAGVSYDKSLIGNNLTASGSAGNDIITIKDYNQTLKLRQTTKANRPTVGNREITFVSANADNLVNSATLGNCKTIFIKSKVTNVTGNKIIINFGSSKYLVVIGPDLTPSNVTFEAYDLSLNALSVGGNGPNSRAVTADTYFIAVIKQSTAIDCSSISFTDGSYPFSGSIKNLAFFSTELSDSEVLQVLNYMR